MSHVTAELTWFKK